MALVIRFFKTVRNNWKKSVVFTGLAVYGVHYAKGLYEDDLIRREYCAEARKYGDVPVQLGEKARKVTVFLNPAASRGYGKKLFDKNAAPLLYLAGLEVNVVKTEYEGQIKEYMKVFEQKHADAIIVAGGNVSVLELITGMMRREDKEFRQRTPIGIIPVGSSNKFASFFYGPDKSDVRRSLDVAMAIVKGFTKTVDVLKLQGDEGTATYALCGMEAGVYRDAKERTSKYWYFGPLKHRFTYLRSTLSRWPPVVTGSLEYAPLTEENSKPQPKPVTVEEQPKQSWSWKSLLFGRKPAKKVTATVEEEDEYDFIDGDEIVQREVESVEINMSSGYTDKDKKLRGVELELGPSALSKSEFITKGWTRMKEDPSWKMGTDSTNEKILTKKVKFIPKIEEGRELFFNIDGEQFEAKPIAVTLLKDRLKMFTELQPNVGNS